MAHRSEPAMCTVRQLLHRSVHHLGYTRCGTGVYGCVHGCVQGVCTRVYRINTAFTSFHGSEPTFYTAFS